MGNVCPGDTVVVAPTESDMKAAKLLYVRLTADYTKNPDVKSLDDLKKLLGDGGATGMWTKVEGLRHKYFVYDEKTDVCCGVYVFYNENSLKKYIDSELFKMHNPTSMPHFSKVEYEVLDVMPGTELAIERTQWPHSPPTRNDVTNGKMLIVDITVDFNTVIEGLPASSAHLYGFMSSEASGGTGYPGMFGGLEGLRGKYFAWNEETNQCFGFYTFINETGLNKYMASDLFKEQGAPPHIKTLNYKVMSILPGTERTTDMGTWSGK